MKNTINILSLLLIFTFANAQNDETYWTLSLSNQFFAHNNNSITYKSSDRSVYENVYNSSNGLYTFQPSLQKHKGRFFTEFGLRNTGYSDKTIWKYDNYHFSNTSSTLYNRQISASITAFFSKNMRILGNKNGLYIGGDIFFNTNYIQSRYWDQIDETNDHNLSKTTLGIGCNIIPRYQFFLGNRIYSEFAILIKLVSYSVGFQNTYFPNQAKKATTSSSFSFYDYASPQISIGLKL